MRWVGRRAASRKPNSAPPLVFPHADALLAPLLLERRTLPGLPDMRNGPSPQMASGPERGRAGAQPTTVAFAAALGRGTPTRRRGACFTTVTLTMSLGPAMARASRNTAAFSLASSTLR